MRRSASPKKVKRDDPFKRSFTVGARWSGQLNGAVDSPDTGVAGSAKTHRTQCWGVQCIWGNAVKLDDLKVSSKVLLPALVLAVATVACAGLGVWQQKRADAATEVLVKHRSPAEVQSARFLRRISMMGYAAHRTTTYEGASEQAASASQELDKVFGEGKESLDKITAADPKTSDYTAGMKTKLDAAYADARSAADLALKNDDAGAVAGHELEAHRSTRITLHTNGC